MNFKLLAFLIITASAVACGSSTENKVATNAPSGEEKFNAYCSSCHNESGAVAPPAVVIQKTYKQRYADETKFAERIADFVNYPTKQKVILKPSAKKFGLMPAMNYSREELMEIGKFIYSHEFKKQEEEGLPDDMLHAMEIVKHTKQALGKNLMQKIKKGGPITALEFCNVKAIPLTDSVAQSYATFVQRVSDKPRNPANKTSEAETKMILAYQEELNSKQTLKPQTIEVEGKKWFYAPIITNQMCLQCHGEPAKNIKPNVLSEIQKRYPEDKATGYTENQVRGLFKVKI